MTGLFNLEGQCAIVTGASGGLGRHFAKTLARAGAKVALAARREDQLKSVAEEIAAFDGRAFPVHMDVTQGDAVKAAVETVETELGPVTILVNNSGIVARKPIFEHEEADWDAVVDTNLKGAWLLSLEVARHMVKHDVAGSIINIASILGYDRVSSQVPEYCASKAGLVQLTKSMATELARNKIRVNAIAPGYFITDLNRDFLTNTEGGEALRSRIPQRRFGAPEDLDGVLLLLASNASSFMTGSVITVDGGHSVVSV
ncbi:MAG: glucose 1-dehydrogenase [Pseudomonadota bacterium]